MRFLTSSNPKHSSWRSKPCLSKDCWESQYSESNFQEKLLSQCLLGLHVLMAKKHRLHPSNHSHSSRPSSWKKKITLTYNILDRGPSKCRATKFQKGWEQIKHRKSSHQLNDMQRDGTPQISASLAPATAPEQNLSHGTQRLLVESLFSVKSEHSQKFYFFNKSKSEPV